MVSFGLVTLRHSETGTTNFEIIIFNICLGAEVGNTADTPNPPRVYPFKGNLGVPTGQRKFDLGGV